jgi:hypothetical protein
MCDAGSLLGKTRSGTPGHGTRRQHQNLPSNLINFCSSWCFIIHWMLWDRERCPQNPDRGNTSSWKSHWINFLFAIWTSYACHPFFPVSAGFFCDYGWRIDNMGMKSGSSAAELSRLMSSAGGPVTSPLKQPWMSFECILNPGVLDFEWRERIYRRSKNSWQPGLFPPILVRFWITMVYLRYKVFNPLLSISVSRWNSTEVFLNQRMFIRHILHHCQCMLGDSATTHEIWPSSSRVECQLEFEPPHRETLLQSGILSLGAVWGVERMGCTFQAVILEILRDSFSDVWPGIVGLYR